jgi:chemotaxis protein histidine kinase CheA
MNERSRQLRALFRANAVEQLAHLSHAVHDLRRGEGDSKSEGAIAPLLHVMMGDAALVGLMALAAGLHAAEEHAAAGAWDKVTAALGVVASELGRADDDGTPADASVDPAVRRRWVRMQTDAIDELSTRLLELSTAYHRLAAGLVRSVQDAPEGALRELADNADAARRQLDEVLGAAWSLRLASIEDLLLRIADHAIELARAQGKPLQIRIDGGRAELERPTLEAMEEPLLRLVLNAVLHGIEEPGARGPKPAEATLALEARVAGGAVEIAIEDDGRGIDPAAVRAAAVDRGLLGEADAAALTDEATLELLFALGAAPRRFGGGIGLAVVRARVESLGGAVALSSRPGLGTRCVVSVPAAIARERAIVVECGGDAFALPAREIGAQIRIGDHARRRIAGGAAIRIGDAWVPLCRLDEVLGIGAGAAPSDDAPALVLEGSGRRRAFAVDRIAGEQELLRRPADELTGLGALVSASSVTAGGRVALWPAVPALLSGRRDPARGGAPPSPAPRARRVLVVDDSLIVRELVSSMLRSAELVARTAPDGEAAWHALEEELPDLVLTDVDMPRLDGLELLRRIRECWPTLPVVVLTTRDDDPYRHRAQALGASAYILKSELDERRLVETVRSLIDESIGGPIDDPKPPR